MIDWVVRKLAGGDRTWVKDFITQHWGAEIVVAHSVVYRPDELPGLVALRGEQVVGLVTFHVDGDACEVVTLDSTQAGVGIGTALIDAVKPVANQAGCKKLWLITTNEVQFRLQFLPGHT